MNKIKIGDLYVLDHDSYGDYAHFECVDDLGRRIGKKVRLRTTSTFLIAKKRIEQEEINWNKIIFSVISENKNIFLYEYHCGVSIHAL